MPKSTIGITYRHIAKSIIPLFSFFYLKKVEDKIINRTACVCSAEFSGTSWVCWSFMWENTIFWPNPSLSRTPIDSLSSSFPIRQLNDFVAIPFKIVHWGLEAHWWEDFEIENVFWSRSSGFWVLDEREFKLAPWRRLAEKEDILFNAERCLHGGGRTHIQRNIWSFHLLEQIRLWEEVVSVFLESLCHYSEAILFHYWVSFLISLVA